MSSKLVALTFDAHDPEALARFWGGLLGWDHIERTGDARTVLPADGTGFRLHFEPSTEPKRGPNQAHFDLTSNLASQESTVARALSLGARHIDVGQLPEEGHVVLADPDGNEFCVIQEGNNFLADTGFIGALASDGTQAVGYFWAAALDWPLVWDQDEETAIQSPTGGPKITWGGPPVAPKLGKNRLHFDLRADGDLDAEVERLLGLGAKHLDIGQGEVDWVVLADPDGNEFCVLPPA
ncbi:putative enzyme related to lactoylglutathione lyase [Crossiella equi]|uniref:Enzyme related to lactoylglutathione lyase n=1 Tax=Crossiella equi TaxID=130796 RepID=A0ABS5A8E2_9PSEU|nr:VOC family protein [Crossiella equi]MBP2472494.1 putative enzyme related to lactoylglutathione lyase [Crossiella equi]